MILFSSGIPAFRRGRQDNEEFKVTVSYTPSSRTTWTTRDSPSKKKKKKKKKNNSIRKMNMAIHILNPYTGEAKVRGSTDPGWLAGLHRKALFKRLSNKSVWYLDPQGSVAFCYQAGLIVITLSRPGWFWNVSCPGGAFVSRRPHYLC